MFSRLRWPRASVLASLGLTAVLVTGGAEPAQAYEFEVIARTLGQGTSLRSLRLTGPTSLLARRAFTQTLSLNIWDIGGTLPDRRPYLRPLDRMRTTGPKIHFTSYLRIDHDFGAWSTGTLVFDNRIYGAVDLIPELETRLLALDVLFAYLAVDDLAGGALHVRVGRQLEVGALDWWSMDGVTVRATPDLPVAFEGFAGLRVRDSSYAASATFEPDGTGSAECAEYLEGPVPGSGSWRPIDLGLNVEDNPFSSDYQLCPQRQQVMPTYGGAVALQKLDNVWARIGYRRSVSPTAESIAGAGTQANEDTGLYPNEDGGLPDWGVNEDFLTATVRFHDSLLDRRADFTAYAGVRYNGLVGTVDEHHTGMRFLYRTKALIHSLEPEYFYSFPTFDGDSIFNVFSIQAYHDMRLTYGLRSARYPLTGYVRGWVRKFATEDEVPNQGDGSTEAHNSDWTGGVQLGLRYNLPRLLSARVDLFQDAGYGGSRIGGYASLAWRKSVRTGFRGRVSVVHFDEDLRPDLHGVTLGLQAGASYVINTGITAHVTAEHTSNRIQASQLRVIGALEFALVPEI